MQPWQDGRQVEAVGPKFVPRVRREMAGSRDVVNARMYESWQTEAPALYNNRNDPGAQKGGFMDMAPLSSRQDTKSYRQSQPYEVGSRAEVLAGNPYFQKFDVTQDPRNVARELRGSVFEEKADRGLKENKSLMEREFKHRNVNESVAEQAVRTRLEAGTAIRPVPTDTLKDYRLAASGGWTAEARGSWAGSTGW